MNGSLVGLVNGSAVAIIGDTQAKAIVDAVCPQFPVFDDIDMALRSAAKVHTICILAPKFATLDSIRTIVDAGVNVLCGGPPTATRQQLSQLDQMARQRQVRIRLGGRERHVPQMLRLKQLRESQAFGEPVYARSVTGGGTSILAAWWSMCELLAGANWLLHSQPQKIVIGATRKGRARLHIVMTVAMANRANAQLCVAPGVGGNLADTWLLGSGGTLSSRSEDGDIIVAQPGRRDVLGRLDPATLGERQWIAEFVGEGKIGLLTEVSTLETNNRLLSVLRRSLKQGRLLPCY